MYLYADQRANQASMVATPLALLIAGPAITRLGVREVLAGAAAVQLVVMLMLGSLVLSHWPTPLVDVAREA
jgi:hypothetical protein